MNNNTKKFSRVYVLADSSHRLICRLIRRVYKNRPNLPYWAYAILNYNVFQYARLKQDHDFFLASQEMVLQDRICLSLQEMWAVYAWARRSARVEGDLAEVGVFKGGSAKLICRVKGQRKLHLFDTFEEITHTEAEEIKVGDVTWGLKDVQSLLAGYPNVVYHKGLFAQTSKELEAANTKFSFVHLDADYYEPLMQGLRFFYPRMPKGVVLIVHDYNSPSVWPGARKAVDEFFTDKPETVLDTYETQALVIKQ